MDITAARNHRRAQPRKAHNNAVFVIALLWAVTLAVIFLTFRGTDVGNLRRSLWSFVHSFGSVNPIAVRDTVLGAVVSLLAVCAWLGFGDFLESVLKRLDGSGSEHASPLPWSIATKCAWGAGITSLLMFLFGVTGLYTLRVGTAALAVGLVLFARTARHLWSCHRSFGNSCAFSRVALVVTCIPLVLGAIAALAPPIAKDTLLYHIALPKAFLTAQGLADVRYNVAQFYALGAELNGTWTMLLGRAINPRVGEAAFGFCQFAYLPILLLALFGWMRYRGSSSAESLIPVSLVASIPTIYSSASSGYNDCALAVYVTLAIAAAVEWWKKPQPRSAVQVGLALGFALTIKLLAVFVIVPLSLLVLIRLRLADNDSRQEIARVLRTSLIAVVLVAATAGPWYVRNWLRTGSPVYPFYMNIVHGSAPGWDAGRSVADQLLNAQYGGYPKSALDYVAVPIRLSVNAQPEFPQHFDGVLGISFLFGMPVLIVALYRKHLDIDTKIVTALSGMYFFLWLFSSEQLRYLLPVLPALAVVICTSVSMLDRRLRLVVLATALPGLLVIVAWFVQQNPVAVVIGAEERKRYLERSIDHFSMYETVNSQLPKNARVWLINMRRDTYYLERPYFSDFRIEHFTLMQFVRKSNSVEELRQQVRDAGITHILVRTDLLLDYSVSPLVDDSRPRAENEQKLEMLRAFLRDSRVVRKEGRFLLIEVP